jgi:hypothetical protein
MNTLSNTTSILARRPAKVIMSVMLAGLLLVTLLTYFHTHLLLLAASTYLSGHGVSLQSLDNISIGREKVSVREATFLLPASKQLSSIQNLQIEFTLDKLINGRIDHISIDTIELHLAELTSNIEYQPQGTSNSEWVYSIPVILLDFPLQSLSVEHLFVAGFHSEIALKMQIEAQALNVELVSGETNIQLNLVREDQHASIIDIRGIINLAEFASLPNQQRLQIPLFKKIEGEIEFSASARVHTLTQDSDFHINFASQIQAGSRFNTDLFPGADMVPIRLETHFVQPLSLTGSYQGGNKIIHIDSLIPYADIKLSVPDLEVDISIQSSSAKIICEPQLICTTEQSIIASIPTIQYNDIDATSISINIKSNIVLSENTYALTLQDGSRIDTKHVHINNIHSTDAKFVVDETLRILRNSNGDVNISSNTLQLIMPKISMAKITSHALMTANNLEITLPSSLDAKPTLNMSAILRNIGTDFLPIQLRSPEIILDLFINENSHEIEGNLMASQRHLLDFRARYDHLLESGEMEINTPSIIFSPELQTLSQFIFDMPISADIVTGSFQASSLLTLHRSIENSFQYGGSVSLAADNLSGYIAETAFVNLNTFMMGNLSETLDFTSDTDISLQLGSIDAGIPITDISLLYSIDTHSSQLTFADLQASIFNGRIRSPHGLYNWTSQDNELILSLEDIDLSSMLSLAAYDAVEASGLVSGTIPVSIQGGPSAVSITNGILYVEPPGGSIRYITPVQAGGSQTMVLVNSALRNYQYDVMAATVNYRDTGELELGINLQGVSPELNQGQRINLNLNISDNIPALLNSLQAARSITDTLERALENR